MTSIHALTQGIFDAITYEGGMDRWAHSLRTDADGEDQRPPSRPEFMELRSISHEGRVRWHRKMVLPPAFRPSLPSQQTSPSEEEQLLYVALYRDKIAQHQAEMEAAAKAAQAKESARKREVERQIRNERRTRLVPVRPNRQQTKLAAAAATVAGAKLDGGDGGVELPSTDVDGACADSEAAGAEMSGSGSNTAIAQERGASMPPLMIPSERRGQRQSRDTGAGDGSGRGSGGVAEVASAGSRKNRRSPRLGASSARRSRPAEHAGEDQEGRAATHIASVAAAPGAGGVASEYLETKRLGRLFDEWKAQQLQNVEELPQASSSSPRLSMVRFTENEAPTRTAAKRMAVADSAPSRGGGRSASNASAGGPSLVVPSPRGKGQGASASHVAMALTPAGSQRELGQGPASASSSATSAVLTPSSSKPGSAATTDTPNAKAKRSMSKKATTSLEGKRLASKKRTLTSQEAGDTMRDKPELRSMSTRPSMNEEGFNELDDDASSSGDVSNHAGAGSEKNLVSRLFQVVTNPKVTRETFAERGAGDSTKRGEVPSQVEGFPTLNLMRLYKGPWRLDV